MMCDPSNRSTDVWLRRAGNLTTSVTRFGRFLCGFVRRSWFPLRDPDESGTMIRTAVLTTLCHNSSSVIVCPKQQCTAHSRRFILDVLRAGLFLSICYCVSAPVLAAMPSTGVTVQGTGVPPNLGFACCDQGIEEMQVLFNNQDVIADLKDLHAEVAIPILDFSPERAAAAHRLKQAGIPVIAWILLGKEQGLFLNVDNASEAASYREPRFSSSTARS